MEAIASAPRQSSYGAQTAPWLAMSRSIPDDDIADWFGGSVIAR
jgi:hypothetical protein